MYSLIRSPSSTAKLLVALVCGAILALSIAQGHTSLLRAATPPTSPLFPASAAAPAHDGMADSTAVVDLGWYPPSQTVINNLTNVVSNDTTGVYGFIFNSSYIPDDQYGTYNWCNMPHVRPQEYVRPSEEYELAYVELVSLASVEREPNMVTHSLTHSYSLTQPDPPSSQAHALCCQLIPSRVLQLGL